jgi:hypothetical protein
MQDLIFLVVSVVGIASMVVLCAYLKVWTPVRIENLTDAASFLDEDALGFKAGPGVLSPEGDAALLQEMGTERIALLLTRRDRYVARYLLPGTVTSARMDEDGGLKISLTDFTFNSITMKFDDNSSARLWADKLNALQA